MKSVALVLGAVLACATPIAGARSIAADDAQVLRMGRAVVGAGGAVR